MWNIVVVAVMAALAGIYILPSEQALGRAEDMKARELAGSMAVYRQAVSAYYGKFGAKTNYSATVAELKAGNFLPDWSRLYTEGEAGPWTNYRNAAGIIYIYPKQLPEKNILPDLLELAHNSVSVTVYRATDSSLYSPGDNKRFKHALAGAAIPDGAPVWIASPK